MRFQEGEPNKGCLGNISQEPVRLPTFLTKLPWAAEEMPERCRKYLHTHEQAVVGGRPGVGALASSQRMIRNDLSANLSD